MASIFQGASLGAPCCTRGVALRSFVAHLVHENPRGTSDNGHDECGRSRQQTRKSEKNGAGLRCTIHHSDRGVQYLCDDYVEELIKYGLHTSCSAKGKPYDAKCVGRVVHEDAEGKLDQYVLIQDVPRSARASAALHRGSLQQKTTPFVARIFIAGRV